MPLSAAEVVEVHRQVGYPAAVVSASSPISVVLAAISPEGEAVLRATFLPALQQLEAGLLGASETLDTAKAAVWERNAAEVAERTGLYRATRLALCRFLGVEPGPGIYDMVVVVPGTDPGTGTGGPDSGLNITPAVLVLT